MNNTAPNPMFAKFDQVLGKTTPTTTNAPMTSRADEIMSIANSSNDEEKPKPGMIDSAVSNTAKDYSNAVPNFMAEAGKNDNSTSANPVVRTGENALGATASAVGSVFSPISNAVKSASESFANSGVGHVIEQNPVVGRLLDLFGGASGELDKLAQQHPEAARNLSNLLTVGLTAAGGETGAVEKSVGSVKGITTGVTDAASKVSDAASAIKEKIAPTETIEQTTGKILQGKTGDIQSGKSGLSSLDTSKVKTYADLNKTATDKITELAKKQDVNLDKDPTPRPMSSFEKTTGEGAGSVKTNYVQQSIDNLKELYSNTSDAEGLSKIKTIEAKANGEGLTTKEVNDLARTYGSEFSSKAFGKNGEALTSVNATKFENIRTGLKDTARDLLPDDASKSLDKQMSDIYTVKDLSAKMSEKVNTLSQRLQKPNILQKIGGAVGKGMRITGVGDMASKLLGIDKVPGAATLNAVELEAQLSKNLGRINAALNKSDSGFVKDMIQMIKETPNQQGGFIGVGKNSELIDSVSKELDKYDTSAIKTNHGLASPDYDFRLGQLKDIMGRRALNLKEAKETKTLLNKAGIKF